MNIRKNCPLCNGESRIIDTLNVDQKFEDFIDEYYGDKSFKKINKYIDSFINDKPQELIKELKNPYKKFNRNHSTKLNQDYRKLIEIITE